MHKQCYLTTEDYPTKKCSLNYCDKYAKAYKINLC